MARPQAPFSLFKRSSKHGPVYYAKIRGSDGRYLTTVSTGQSAKVRAAEWVTAEIKRRETDARERETAAERITFRAYADDFWTPDGPYARARRARLHTVSNGHLATGETNTRRHMIPKWGEWPLREMTVGHINAWTEDLIRAGELAPGTINKILMNLRAVLAQAVADGIIRENPAHFVKPVRNVTTERGTYSPEELMRLIGSPRPWADYRHYGLNLLAAVTGARLGEIRGLLVEHVHPDHIDIRWSWEQGHGLKEPKNGSVRQIPIAPSVYEVLDRIIGETRPQSLLFYGDAGHDAPMAKTHIAKHLYIALASIGIDESERVRRNLVFHSWRHTLNTLLRSRGVVDSKVRVASRQVV